MEQGMELDPQILIAVQNERLAAGAIREAQLTAAVQQLTMENIGLKTQLETKEAEVHELRATELVEVEYDGDPMADVEVKDASPID